MHHVTDYRSDKVANRLLWVILGSGGPSNPNSGQEPAPNGPIPAAGAMLVWSALARLLATDFSPAPTLLPMARSDPASRCLFNRSALLACRTSVGVLLSASELT